MTLDPSHAATLAGVSTASITTILLKKGLRNVWMRGPRGLAAGQGRIVGRAFTLRFVPAREDLATPESWASPRSTRAAIEEMPAGCIAVVDALGVADAGIFGDILCGRMRGRRGGAGDRRCPARSGRHPRRRPAGLVQRRRGAALGGRPDLRRLAGADRLRRRGRVPGRRDRRGRGRGRGHPGSPARRGPGGRPRAGALRGLGGGRGRARRAATGALSSPTPRPRRATRPRRLPPADRRLVRPSGASASRPTDPRTPGHSRRSRRGPRSRLHRAPGPRARA